ncbi:hypothetical protein U1Q18_044475 [Sarracenia purpurea var. burkii]
MREGLPRMTPERRRRWSVMEEVAQWSVIEIERFKGDGAPADGVSTPVLVLRKCAGARWTTTASMRTDPLFLLCVSLPSSLNCLSLDQCVGQPWN